MAKSSIYEAVQAAAEKVPGLERREVFGGIRTPAVGGDLTSVKCFGEWLHLGLAVDDTTGLALTVGEVLQDIHALEEGMLAYERKYNVLTETFYESFVNGAEPPDDAWVPDWNDWAATYEIWLRRCDWYQEIIKALRADTTLLSDVIAPAARCESWSVLARLREVYVHAPPAVSYHPPEIKHYRVPAPDMSFTQPNLPLLLREIEQMIET